MGGSISVRKRRQIFRVAGAYAALACLLALACSTTPAHANKADDTVRFAFDQTLPSPDPYFNNQLIGMIVADSVWDTLIFRDPKTGDFRAGLATEWRWIGDRTLELDLRQGVTFHNGATFTADDVVYTLNFVADPRNGTTNLGFAGQIERTVKLAAYKVQIVFKRPFPAALAYIAHPSSVIHPHEYYAEVGPSGVNAHPIGTGPYRVVEHERGKVIRLERNPAYFKDGPKTLPQIGKVEIRFIPDAQTRVAEIVAGGLDLTTRVDRDQAEQLRGIRGLQVMSTESTGYFYLQMNSLPSTPAPPLRDVRVRQAIAHAIDREAMVKFLVGPDAHVRHSECHPIDFGCTEDGVPRYDYDPAKSRQLLVEAGYTNGFDIDIYAFRDRIQADAIIGYLGEVGIRARLRYLQAAALTSAVRSGRTGLVLFTWASLSVNDVSATVSRTHGFNADDTNRDPEIRDLLLSADTDMNPESRKQTYSKLFALNAQRAYVLPLYSVESHYLAARDLRFSIPAEGILRFWEMRWN